MRSRQAPRACLARDWSCSCLDGLLLVPFRIAAEPFLARGRAALLAHDLHFRIRAVQPILRPEKLLGEQSAAPRARLARLRRGEAALLDEGVVRFAAELAAELAELLAELAVALAEVAGVLAAVFAAQLSPPAALCLRRVVCFSAELLTELAPTLILARNAPGPRALRQQPFDEVRWPSNAEVLEGLHEILVAARIVGKHAALARPSHLFEVLLHALVSLLLDELVPVLLSSLSLSLSLE